MGGATQLRWVVAMALLAASRASFAASGDPAFWDKDESPMVAQSGDWLQIGIPLLALGMTYWMRSEDDRTSSSAGWAGTAFDPSSWTHLDGTPRHDLALAFARTEIAVYGLKYGVEAPRPNGSAHSFPSGHTAAAFMGAEFIRQEYGWQWGVPAYAAASFVGWSRIVSGNHWPRDVLAGAAIGILSNYDLDRISTRFGTIEIKPLIRTVDASGLGRPTLGRFADDTERPLRGDTTPMLGLQVGFRF